MSLAVFSPAASSPSMPSAASSSSTSPTSFEDNVDSLADIRLLLQYVARAFYEVRHVLLIDQLIRKEAIKDEELAGRLGIPPRELAKAAHQLVRDQLVSLYMRAETKPGAHKATQRTYYFIDYKHCVDVIKWRMWKMSKVLDDKQRNVIDGQGYVCPRCKKTYSTLDVSGLSMTATSFLCEICSAPLCDNENDVEVQKNKDRMQRLNSQTTVIRQNLQKADKVVVPVFDIVKWVALNMPLDTPVNKTDGLAVATGGAKEAAVTVQLAQDGDVEAKRRLKEQQAEAKRQANALPVWIAQSTVSGDPTRAGPRVNCSGFNRANGVSMINPPAPEVSQLASHADDTEYDAYIARCQNQAGSASSASTLSIGKRSPSGSDGSITSPSHLQQPMGGFGVKRGRTDHPRKEEAYSHSSYDGFHGARSGKKAKTDAPTPPEERDHDDSEEVKTMTLGGKLIELSAITEEMEHNMTPEEYTIYATLMIPS